MIRPFLQPFRILKFQIISSCFQKMSFDTPSYRGAALRARGVCVFLRSCFIRFDISFVLELHTCRHTSSCVLACLYAFKHFLFHELLCLFILYIHIYVFPFHVFCSRCRKRICSPQGFTSVTGCGAALLSHARTPRCSGDLHPKRCYFRVIFILNYEVSPLRVMPLWGV